MAELGVRLLSPRKPPIKPAPVHLGDYFTEENIDRGARFARGQRRLFLARAMVQAAAISGWAWRPPGWLPGRRLPSVAGGAADAAVLAVVSSILPLPLSAAARRRAIAVGLVTQSWRGWALDLAKAGAIECAMAAAAGGATVAITRRYPRGWWIPAAGGSIAFGVLFAGLAPVLLDPLFNDFVPLEDTELRQDVLDLARGAGVKVGEVLKVDASRRTTAANAYVSGLGPTKRVVLFDTLLERRRGARAVARRPPRCGARHALQRARRACRCVCRSAGQRGPVGCSWNA